VQKSEEKEHLHLIITIKYNYFYISTVHTVKTEDEIPFCSVPLVFTPKLKEDRDPPIASCKLTGEKRLVDFDPLLGAKSSRVHRL